VTTVREIIWHIDLATVPASNERDVSERVVVVRNTKVGSILIMFGKRDNIPIVESDIRPALASPHVNDADRSHVR
jgi:hypothetical protein